MGILARRHAAVFSQLLDRLGGVTPGFLRLPDRSADGVPVLSLRHSLRRSSHALGRAESIEFMASPLFRGEQESCCRVRAAAHVAGTRRVPSAVSAPREDGTRRVPATLQVRP